MNSSDRALINAFKEINAMADRINVPRTIVDRANNLFKQVHDGRNLKGNYFSDWIFNIICMVNKTINTVSPISCNSL